MRSPNSFWKECVRDISYPLTVPTWFRLGARVALVWGGLLSFTLNVDMALQLLLQLGLYRSYVWFRRYEKWAATAHLSVTTNDHLVIHLSETTGIRLLTYRVTARYPGLLGLRLECSSGKPMEILVFSLYDHVHDFKRLVRFLANQSYE